MSAALTRAALIEARSRTRSHRDSTDSMDGCIGLDAIDAALKALTSAVTQIVAAMPAGSERALEQVADMLTDISSDVAGHYAEPVLSAVDLRNIRLDVRSKAQRENAA